MKSHDLSAALVTMAALLGTCRPVQGQATSYDLVSHGGRVIDPETDLDAVRDVRARRLVI
jgi:hypothetical protein